MKKTYKSSIQLETETTINLLYDEKILSIYTNNVPLQRKLNKCFGNPTKEYFKGKNIISSRWDISLEQIGRLNLNINENKKIELL